MKDVLMGIISILTGFVTIWINEVLTHIVCIALSA